MKIDNVEENFMAKMVVESIILGLIFCFLLLSEKIMSIKFVLKYLWLIFISNYVCVPLVS